MFKPERSWFGWFYLYTLSSTESWTFLKTTPLEYNIPLKNLGSKINSANLTETECLTYSQNFSAQQTCDWQETVDVGLRRRAPYIKHTVWIKRYRITFLIPVPRCHDKGYPIPIAHLSNLLLEIVNQNSGVPTE